MSHADSDIIAAVFIAHAADRFLPSIRTLVAQDGLPVVLSGPTVDVLEVFGDLDLQTRVAPTAADLVNALWGDWGVSILLVWDPVLVPRDFLVRARAAIDADLRIATVSFLSNNAEHLSFPGEGPSHRPPEGVDETIVTHKLRNLVPEPLLAPVSAAAGGAVVISSSALSATGPLERGPSSSPAGSLTEFSYRARRRGLLSTIDTGTFVSRPSDLSVVELGGDMPPEERQWIAERHPFGPILLEHERASATAPASIAMQAARTKVSGLRVLIDGTNLGPTQMGTQTTILALVEALAERDDVAHVGVVLAGDLPPYAAALLSHRKVIARWCPQDDFSSLGHFDVGHRPFQPDQAFDSRPWHKTCDRLVVSVLDLIGYQIGSYFLTPGVWLEYRDALQRAVSMADGVTVISGDVRTQVELEQLSIDADRLHVVHYGTEHLLGEEPARVPSAVLDAGRLADDFVLCLGTNYTHKNRDLAIRTWRELRARGHALRVVLAGAFVPFGSSRIAESFVYTHEDDVIVLPDVADDERNWLLRHARLVLYPTSAEGFGLVPFEAARFGTPTVSVGFGPLGELGASELPSTARNWSVDALADAAEKILADPALASRQVDACLAAGRNYTWRRTADELTAVYRRLIAMPPRWPEGIPI